MLKTATPAMFQEAFAAACPKPRYIRKINRAKTRTYILIALLTALTVIGRFSYSNAEVPIRQRERELLNYIEKHTGYQTKHIQAMYDFWPSERINKTYYAANYQGQDDIIALTIQGRVILPTSFNVSQDPEVLLHELFHLVVFENSIKFQCRAAEEKAAYALQKQFVDEVGFGREPSPLFIKFLTCNPYM